MKYADGCDCTPVSTSTSMKVKPYQSTPSSNKSAGGTPKEGKQEVYGTYASNSSTKTPYPSEGTKEITVKG